MKRVLKILAVIVFIGLFPSFTRIQTNGKAIPDAATAIKIALDKWTPIYGSKLIESEKPYKAELEGDSVWFVHGTLPEGWNGGTAEMRIRKKDGKILSVTHGQ